jgi:NDP-sugar pyrophosphorylase family protein
MAVREAVVLAAGLGLRMRPLTGRTPKPALPFLNRPILHWTLGSLAAAGVERVFINLHHLPQAVREAAESGASGLDLKFSFEPTILGTAGVFGPLRGLLQGDAFFVVNGDVVHSLDYGALEASLRTHPEALAALALLPRNRSYTPVALDGERRITGFGGEGEWIFPGVYAARRTLLDHLPGPGPRELVPDLLRPLLPSGAVRGVPVEGRWLDLGDPVAYLSSSLAALRDAASGALPVPEGSLLEMRDGHPLLRHRKAWVSRDATLTGPVVAGRGVRVEPRAHVGRLILLEGASVARGQRLEDGILQAGESARTFLSVRA